MGLNCLFYKYKITLQQSYTEIIEELVLLENNIVALSFTTSFYIYNISSHVSFYIFKSDRIL